MSFEQYNNFGWVYNNGEGMSNGFGDDVGSGNSADDECLSNGSAYDTRSPGFGDSGEAEFSHPSGLRNSWGDLGNTDESSGDGRHTGDGAGEHLDHYICSEQDVFYVELPRFLTKGRRLISKEEYEKIRALGEATTTEEFNNIIGLFELGVVNE